MFIASTMILTRFMPYILFLSTCYLEFFNLFLQMNGKKEFYGSRPLHVRQGFDIVNYPSKFILCLAITGRPTYRLLGKY